MLPPPHPSAMSKAPPHDDTPERLLAIQESFAGHIRNPDEVSAPGDVEDRRMKIYRDLFFKNILNFMSGGYPVLKSLYSDEDWTQLVRDFFIEHRCRTPLFPELTREFLRYLQEGRQDREGDPPFLLELAHYEWVELGLKIEATELDKVEANPEGDLLEESPVLSPLAWPLSYRFPVHEICKEFQPTEPPPRETHLLVYRRRDDEVRFMQINAVSRLLLEQMQTSPEASGREMLRAVAAAIGRPDPDELAVAGKALLEGWRDKDIVLGTRPANDPADN